MIGLTRSERAVDRQRVAGSKESIELPLGAAIVWSHRATRCIALPAYRICCGH
jgi:hypothetical protein